MTEAGGIARDPRLVAGLARNSLFNVLGWAMPVVLYLLATPLIVHGLGDERFGVFGIASIAAGYLAFLATSNTTGNVRFLAEAFGRGDWSEFRSLTRISVWLGIGIGGAACLLLIAASRLLAERAFAIPADLVPEATWCIRLAATGFLLNTLMGSLSAVPTSLRRYGVVNVVNLIVGVGNTIGVATVVRLGWGLKAAVAAQVASSAVGVLAFGIVSWSVVRHLPRAPTSDRQYTRRMLSFTSLMAFGGIGNTIGSQMDRTVIAALLGPVAVTYYTVPSRVADQVTQLLGRITTALYPLAAEGLGAGDLDEVRRLYLASRRLMLWLAAAMAVPLILMAHEIMRVWMGPEFAVRSTPVLMTLAAVAFVRAPFAVSWPVANGLGRADVVAAFGWGWCLSYSLPVIALTPRFGIAGAAFGCLIGMVPLAVGSDLFVQFRLLHEPRWSVVVRDYALPATAAAVALGAGLAVPGFGLPAVALSIIRAGTGTAVLAGACALLERDMVRSLVRHLRSMIGRQ